jgi:hypothetical protein
MRLHVVSTTGWQEPGRETVGKPVRETVGETLSATLAL